MRLFYDYKVLNLGLLTDASWAPVINTDHLVHVDGIIASLLGVTGLSLCRIH